jgi:hypothetical protein
MSVRKLWWVGLVLLGAVTLPAASADALELTGQGFDPAGNPNAPSIGEFAYDAWSDGAPIGFAGNGGELWRIDYFVTNPVTDAATDMAFSFGPAECRTFFGGVCPGTSSTDVVTASLRIDAIPEPNTLLLLGFGFAVLARSRSRTSRNSRSDASMV